MARPTPITVDRPKPVEETIPEGYAPAYFIMVPGLTYKAISMAASKRGMTVAELVSRAFSEYLQKTGD